MVNLPLEFDTLTQSYQISFKTIHKWIDIVNNIQKTTKPK